MYLLPAIRKSLRIDSHEKYITCVVLLNILSNPAIALSKKETETTGRI